MRSNRFSASPLPPSVASVQRSVSRPTNALRHSTEHGGCEVQHTAWPKPLVVKPRGACVLLGCGMTYLYELINAGEIESFKDGKSRKITTASIDAYIARHLEASKGSA